ncbi:MAG: C39 family peptidase [Archangiaceae bacterium]|nr:C39 family peptidase [Archangiaceae bacterium]
MPPVHHAPKAQQLARRAFKHELDRAGSAHELKPLAARARQMLHRGRSDAFVLHRLEHTLDHSPEGRAVDEANHLSRQLLGEKADPALLQLARELTNQGTPEGALRAALQSSIEASAGYRRLHADDTVLDAYDVVLQRDPSHHEQLAAVRTVNQLIDQGQSGEQVTAALQAQLAGTPEGRKLHAADNVNAVYAFALGRAPSADELQRGTALVKKLVDDGKSNDEVNQTLGYLCTLTPEWQAKQMSHDRDALYLHQPNGWTCGPTSLAMAMAAVHQRPLNEDTVWEMAGPDKLNTIANHSTDKMPAEIAELVRGMGAHAEPHELAQPAEIRAALERGHGMVVNGKLPDTEGHFIYLAGLDAQGQFIVCDPWHPDVTRWNDEQLGAFTYGRGNSVEIWP